MKCQNLWTAPTEPQGRKPIQPEITKTVARNMTHPNVSTRLSDPHGPQTNHPKVFITNAKAPNWSIQLNIFSTLAEQVKSLNLRTVDTNPKRPAHPNYHLKKAA